MVPTTTSGIELIIPINDGKKAQIINPIPAGINGYLEAHPVAEITPGLNE
jgi:hypothetical protein